MKNFVGRSKSQSFSGSVVTPIFGLSNFSLAEHLKGIGDRNRNFYQQLTRAGYALTGGQINADFGWSSWKHQLDEILVRFYPFAE